IKESLMATPPMGVGPRARRGAGTTPERWRRIEAAFQSALELTPDRRQAYLQALVAEDDALGREVAALVADDEGAASFGAAIGNPAAQSLGTPPQGAVRQDVAAVVGDGHGTPASSMSGESRRGAVVGGDFRIEGLLGRGGMGTVYRVVQISTERPRALKLLHPFLAADSAARERFFPRAPRGARSASPHA